MKEIFLKRSAVHNLIITDVRNKFKSGEISEGLVIPKNILAKSDILPWEQVIVTKINGNNWVNRIKTFVIEGGNNGKVEARGSLSKFFKRGDLTCLITGTILNRNDFKLYENDKLPIFDLGFDPKINKNNLIKTRLDIEFKNKKLRDIKKHITFSNSRSNIKRIFLSSLILNLKINKTHPDCLQGSAELPEKIMNKAKFFKYQSVAVFNNTKGGVAETYAVPMPPGVVMTTGAMAKFAKKGDIVNVATYNIDIVSKKPKIIFTTGKDLI